MKTRGLVLGIVLAGVLCGASMLAGVGTAWASPFLDFEILAGANGSVSWNGDALPLVGSSIDVSDVAGKGGTPANNGVKLNISGGLLNFTSGAFAGTTTDSWNFNAGGTFAITGAISGIGIVDTTTLLLGGSFTSAKVTQTTDGILVALGGIVDVKNPDLLKFYGFNPVSGLLQGSLNLSFLVDDGVSVGDAFASTSIGSGNVLNKVPVPEPAAATLLASSLLPALVFAVSRRRRS